MKVGLREGVSYAFLGLYALYGLFGIGMTGLLFSFAVGLLVLSTAQPVEVVVAATIFAGVAWKLLFDRKKEGFAPNGAYPKVGKPTEGFQVPVGTGSTGPEIVKKIEQITRKNAFEPSGVLSSTYVEGFADSGDAATPPSDTGAAGSEKKKDTPPTAESKPADANAPAATANLAKDLPNPSVAAVPPPQTSGFTDKATDGMFKLGSIPADSVGGSHIDVGTTLMNALNSLKPDQVKAMTDDTRKLMETQKSLIGMLNTMKPMLQDGKELMNTFQDMFGSAK